MSTAPLEVVMSNAITHVTHAPAAVGESSKRLVRFSDELQPHVKRRMQQRGITQKMISLTEQYGRVRYAKGAHHYIVGRKEVARAAAEGRDLRSCYGLHLLPSPQGRIITVYRNRNKVSVRPPKKMSRRLFRTDLSRSWYQAGCEMEELASTFENEIYNVNRQIL